MKQKRKTLHSNSKNLRSGNIPEDQLNLCRNGTLRVLVLCLSFALMLNLCACGSKEESSASSSAGTSAPAETAVAAGSAESDMTASDYYQTNSKIIKEEAADQSETVQTEEEVTQTLQDRGFDDSSITTDYSMDGTYEEGQEVDNSSSDKHPIYQSYYVSANEELWTIYSINGTVMANPVFFNLESGLDAQVIVSESESVTSYDSATNTFYDTIPNADSLIVVQVDQIDAATLDSLTDEEIMNHVNN